MKNRRSPEWKKLSEEEVHSVKDVGNIEFEYLNTLEKDATKEDSKALAFSFIALVIVGLGNKGKGSGLDGLAVEPKLMPLAMMNALGVS